MDYLIEIDSDIKDWDISAFVQVVHLCIEKEKWKLGLGILRFALEEYPGHFEFYHLMGSIYAKQGDNSKALKCFLDEENAINTASAPLSNDEEEMYDITDNLLSIATCFLSAIETENALSYLSTLIIKFGDEQLYTVAQAYYLRASIYKGYEKHEEADSDIRNAIKILDIFKSLPGFIDDLELGKNLQEYLKAHIT
jgi:tetratricopeptide (TPR) repeat protein